ncbi:MAG: ATP-binding cassette domain-containing protein [Deltaproteobacteria bacterium]|nr:ATP-binding cassette domain-containing protein [Deltaproteobacteria bacterium]
MITASNVSLAFGKRSLFKEVNIKFTPGNCYGLIGANGSGKSTFMKILSGEIEQDTGEIIIPKNERLGVLAQDHFAFDEFTVMHTVIKGHKQLYDIMVEKDEIYMKEDFSDEDGIRASELEGEFAELGGWEAESEAASLLSGLGVEEDLFEKKMADLEDNIKVRILLAQAIFGNPETLLLDEPTNHLDMESINWLEEFLLRFQNTVIVVSHDRHFLNKVCTHIADIDYSKISVFVGNYFFWQQASQMIAKQRKDQSKKADAKAAELKSFIQRFSANASKSKQATSRKKELDKLELNDLPSTSRRFPYVAFKPERETGTMILETKGLSKTIEGEAIFTNLDLTINKGDKVALVGPNNYAKSIFMQIIAGEMEADSGSFDWGVTTTQSYFPKDNTDFFNSDINMTDWLRQFSDEQDESYIRGFLGRMLFSGDESIKSVNVLSGGEKVRCMLSKIMLSEANVLIFDEPTAHLDLESITSLNNGLVDFTEVLIFSSHDHEIVNTVANRIIEFTPSGIIDRQMKFDDYLNSENVKKARDIAYGGEHLRLTI